MPNKILIDARLLKVFKRHALRTYPREFAQSLWGSELEDCVDVHAMVDVEVKRQTGEEIEFEYEDRIGMLEQQGLKFVGTIHSHPDGECKPSGCDLASADDELVLGIVSIRKGMKRRFTSVGFFDREGKQMILEVGE